MTFSRSKRSNDNNKTGFEVFRIQQTFNFYFYTNKWDFFLNFEQLRKNKTQKHPVQSQILHMKTVGTPFWATQKNSY